MSGLLVAGTSSDAGKSLVVTGLCRALYRRGLGVAPFKAQNMSNNSWVVPPDLTGRSGEIGRAQVLQAQAACLTPTTAMNPVLLKPGNDRRSHVVLRGRPFGTLESGEYATGRGELAAAAFAAFEELAAAHQLVVCEGAGSPAEINLRASDYVNLGLARRYGLPVIVVGDIDRGGVLASLFGTWAIVDAPDRAHLAAYVINKFRGDPDVLEPGLVELTARTGMPCLGVLPWLDTLGLDSEDSVGLGVWGLDHVDPGHEALTIAVIGLPRVSNATDVDALAHEPGVSVSVTRQPAVVLDADVVVVPGTRSTISDLDWLRRTGLAAALTARHAAGRTTIGICGGYQMLADRIIDGEGVEGVAREVPGLGLLPVDVVFSPEKVLAIPRGEWAGLPVAGYEIHHGRCDVQGAAEAFLDGCRVGPTWGTLWHGIFENDAFRRAWLTTAARAAGRSWRPDMSSPPFVDRRERMIDTLADAIETHLDVDKILAMTGIAG